LSDADFVKNLFGSISQTYDRANDLITFGLARSWRRKLVRWSGAKNNQKILDCATGTGDLAFEFKKVVGTDGSVTGIDFCKEMLDLAPEKSLTLGLPVHFQLGNVMGLDFQDHQFDVTSIAYGIRNVADCNAAIKEMARVTQPGGRVMVLETGEIQNPILRIFIRFYFEKIVPHLGGWISGRPDAYQYLQRTSGDFPSGAAFCQRLYASGCFSRVEYKSLLGGASYIYKADRKIE
jgi:demethylmenaquinone methyltransferase / 2-methoxy-6-polyprenyl-1,4-benzoquinol methylase